MFRAQVKNTFFELVVCEDGLATSRGAGKARSRSTETLRCTSCAPGSEACKAQAERLTSLLNAFGPASLPAQPAHAAPASPKVGGLATTKTLGLKTVDSNNSVSTMCPQDWDVIEDDDCDFGEGHYAQCQHRQQQQQAFVSSTAPSRTFQHSRVPKVQDLAGEFSKTSCDAPPTTLMLRNIPNRYSQKELIKELETLGLAGTFDFFYAPIDTGSMGNVGYAFVNFVAPEHAEQCKLLVSGYAFKKHQRKTNIKVASVSVAHLQGLEANIRHYEHAAVNGRSRAKRCGPVILRSNQ